MLTEQFRKSTRSGGGNGCVEVAFIEGKIHVRDTKQAAQLDRPVLVFTPTEWWAFTAGAKDGEFDLPK